MSAQWPMPDAKASADGLGGTITLGSDMTFRRLGFGAMRLCGPGVWGEPSDPVQARAVLKRVVELGIALIDTADSYGPEVNERFIAETLHPYPEGLVVATKGGSISTSSTRPIHACLSRTPWARLPTCKPRQKSVTSDSRT